MRWTRGAVASALTVLTVLTALVGVGSGPTSAIGPVGGVAGPVGSGSWPAAVRTPVQPPAVPGVSAHRGLTTDAEPEASMQTLRSAAEAGYEVGIDLRYTADQVPVVIHDPTTTRTLTCPDLLVAELTLAELRSRCDLAGMPPGSEVPTWAEAFAELAPDAGRWTLGVELKVADLTDPIREALLAPLCARPDLIPHVLWTAFDGQALLDLVAYGEAHGVAGLPTGFLYSQERLPPAAVIAATGPGTVVASPKTSLVTPAYVAALHQAGLRVAAWTANTEQEWAMLRDARVDTIITDAPDEAWRYLTPAPRVATAWTDAGLTFRFPTPPPGASSWQLTVDGVTQTLPASTRTHTLGGLSAPVSVSWAAAAANPRVVGRQTTATTVLPAAPLPPERLAIRFTGAGRAVLSWSAPPSTPLRPRDGFLVLYAGETFATSGTLLTVDVVPGQRAWSVQAIGPQDLASPVVQGPERQGRNLGGQPRVSSGPDRDRWRGRIEVEVRGTR